MICTCLATSPVRRCLRSAAAADILSSIMQTVARRSYGVLICLSTNSTMLKAIWLSTAIRPTLSAPPWKPCKVFQRNTLTMSIRSTASAGPLTCRVHSTKSLLTSRRMASSFLAGIIRCITALPGPAQSARISLRMGSSFSTEAILTNRTLLCLLMAARSFYATGKYPRTSTRWQGPDLQLSK